MIKTGSRFAHILEKRFVKIYLFCLVMNLSWPQIKRWDMNNWYLRCVDMKYNQTLTLVTSK